MSIAVSLILVVFFLAMNAFFVIAEFAMVRVRPSQIEMALVDKRQGAASAKIIASNVNAYLSACQLGITLASLALGWLGEPAFSELIRPLLAPLGISSTVISAIAVALGYLIMTTLHVVVGELIPKSFAIFSTERYALLTAPVLVWFYRITYPIMWIFNSITNGVMRLFGHDLTQEHEVYTDEEIKLLIDESTESGLIDPEQNEIVDNVFDIDEKDAEAIMTPRTDIICVDLDDPLQENLQLIRQYKYTRYPVCRGNKDMITGFLHVKDLFGIMSDAALDKPGSTAFSSNDDLPIRPIEAVPESIPVSRLLQVFRDKHTEIAVVVDEHGGTSGIVTMSDVMEQIVGGSQDEYDHGDDSRIVALGDGAYQIEGLLPIDDVVELIGFEPPEVSECETAGGLLLALFDRIPAQGDSVSTTSDDDAVTAQFTVLAMDRLRIDQIKVELR